MQACAHADLAEVAPSATERVSGGTEAAKPGKHSLTAAVEKRIDLLKGTMSKAFADLTDSGHTVDVVMLMHESCMAHKLSCATWVCPPSAEF